MFGIVSVILGWGYLLRRFDPKSAALERRLPCVISMTGATQVRFVEEVCGITAVLLNVDLGRDNVINVFARGAPIAEHRDLANGIAGQNVTAGVAAPGDGVIQTANAGIATEAFTIARAGELDIRLLMD